MASVPQSNLPNETIYAIRRDNNFEIYSLIWLDASINCEENLAAQEKLRSSINYLQTFDKLDQCKKYILSVSSDDRIVLIISGHFGQQLIPEIHHLRQISSIYIYCTNKEFHQLWSKQYNKIKGIHNQLNELINQIQSDQSRRRSHKTDEPLSISIFDSKTNSEQSTTGLDGRFVQYQLLLSCLLKLDTTPEDKNEFILQCRQKYETNESQLKIVNEFAQDYVSEHSIWWYTRDSFIYRSLNKALRIQNIHLLFLFRFYIRDMEKQLEENQYPSYIHLYRGQSMSKEELNVLKNSEHNLISVNSFFSTTSNPKVASIYLDENRIDKSLERVLFEIEADPNKIGVKPFADISKFSYYEEEDEILMMLGSIFYLNEIYLDDNEIWHIQMTLCSDKEDVLKNVFDYMKNQYGSMNSRLLLFANVLIDMAHFDDAEKYLLRLLIELRSHHEDIFKGYHEDIPRCYHALGKVSCEKGNYAASLIYFNTAFEILKKLKSDDPQVAYLYNGIGEVYQNKGDLAKAMEYYEKALYIFKQTFTEADEPIAWCYNNIGIIYEKQKEYSKALDYLEKSLTIKINVLPDKHPCLGNTYNNLGNVYYYLKEYDQALKKYKLSYEIFEKSLKPHHPSIARTLKNIGVAYEAKKEYGKATIYYEKALDIWERILSLSHPDLIEIKKDIARVSSKNE